MNQQEKINHRLAVLMILSAIFLCRFIMLIQNLVWVLCTLHQYENHRSHPGIRRDHKILGHLGKSIRALPVSLRTGLISNCFPFSSVLFTAELIFPYERLSPERQKFSRILMHFKVDADNVCSFSSEFD